MRTLFQFFVFVSSFSIFTRVHIYKFEPNFLNKHNLNENRNNNNISLLNILNLSLILVVQQFYF